MTTTTATATTSTASRGTIYYDGDCNLCTGAAKRFGPMLGRRGFELMPLQTPGTAARLDVAPDKLLNEVRLQTSDGRTSGGADAFLVAARHVWWATPLWAISLVPSVRPLLRWLYRRVVPYRYCVAGRCGRPGPFMTWSPAILLPAGALALQPRLPAWAFMWLMAAAVYYAAKWVTWRLARPALRVRWVSSLGYLFAWPGMDADEFLGRGAVAPPAQDKWLAPLLHLLLGFALIWLVARFVLPHDSVLAGWTGMIGLILLLHFGLFDVIALLWQTAGVNARPIMDRAISSTSVAEFWGRRWNRGFSDLTRRLVFAPVRRRLGGVAALVAVFVASGLIHELVITLPARGGYGGPTGYFLLQAAAILAERSRPARHLGLGRGARGWGFTALVTVAPLPLLFPPVFVERVILPFMHTIGAFAAPDIDRPTLIRLAGLLHFGILLASALVPGVLDWRRELAKLQPLTRHLVWVHGAFIVLTIVGFGVVATLNASELAAGSMLARSFCALVAIFWLARLYIQFFLFDARPYLTSLPLKLGYHGLTVVFSILVLVFTWSALAPA